MDAKNCAGRVPGMSFAYSACTRPHEDEPTKAWHGYLGAYGRKPGRQSE
jgi:hypothetical protein